MEFSEKVRQWSAPLMFLMLPFAVIGPGISWEVQGTFFVMAIAVPLALSLKNRYLTLLIMYIFAWQILTGVSFLAAEHIPGTIDAVTGLKQIGNGAGIMLHVIAAVVFFRFITESSISDAKWHLVIRIAVLVQIFIAGMQYFGINLYDLALGLFMRVRNPYPNQLTGTLGNRNFLVAFIGISLPFFVGRSNIRIRTLTVNPVLIFIMFAMLFIPGPGLAAAFIGLSVYYKSWKIVILGIAGALIYSGWHIIMGQGQGHMVEFTRLPGQIAEFWNTARLSDTRAYDLGRFGMWLMALSKTMQSWVSFVFGYGPGAYWGRPYPMHNEYVQTWFELGFLGLSLVIGYLWQSFRFLWINKEMVLFSALLIVSLDMIGNYTMHIPSTGFLAVVVCGLIERKRVMAT